MNIGKVWLIALGVVALLFVTQNTQKYTLTGQKTASGLLVYKEISTGLLFAYDPNQGMIPL